MRRRTAGGYADPTTLRLPRHSPDLTSTSVLS
jgi:hypothetical protein